MELARSQRGVTGNPFTAVKKKKDELEDFLQALGCSVK